MAGVHAAAEDIALVCAEHDTLRMEFYLALPLLVAVARYRYHERAVLPRGKIGVCLTLPTGHRPTGHRGRLCGEEVIRRLQGADSQEEEIEESHPRSQVSPRPTLNGKEAGK